MLRLARRRADRGRDRHRAVHLEAHGRAPHRAHLHEDRRRATAPRPPAGRSSTASSRAPSPPDRAAARPSVRGTHRRMGRSTDAARAALPDNAQHADRIRSADADPKGDSHAARNHDGRGRRPIPRGVRHQGRREARRPRLEGLHRVPRPDRGEPGVGAVRLGRGRLGRVRLRPDGPAGPQGSRPPRASPRPPRSSAPSTRRGRDDDERQRPIGPRRADHRPDRCRSPSWGSPTPTSPAW